MNASIGRLLVFGNYEGDVAKLVDKLNKYTFQEDQVEFALAEDKVQLKSEVILFPSAHPSRQKLYLEDGSCRFADELPTHELAKLLETCDVDCEYMTLQDVSEAFSPLLTSGKICFSAVTYDSKYPVGSLERMSVASDGTVEYKLDTVDCEGCSITEDTYRPGDALNSSVVHAHTET